MEKPKLNDYFSPVLNSFNDSSERKRSEIVDYLTKNYDLLQKDSPKRAFILINTCLGYFLKAKILTKKEDNTYKITARGKTLIRNNVHINLNTLRQFPEFEEFISSRHQRSFSFPKDEGGEKIPEEIILQAYELHKKNLATEILETVKNSSWQFFEILVKDLLVAMGYGDPFDESRITKGFSDEGIDGIIKSDKLGLELIYIQAKKWKNSVGRPEVQRFAGSLDGKRADKGVFITTSNFTREAIEYVKKINKKIVLIDGEKLTELMIDYEIGVTTYNKIFLRKIDSDYFE